MDGPLRQPGQVRKEAAVTRLVRVVCPISRLVPNFIEVASSKFGGLGKCGFERACALKISCPKGGRPKGRCH